MRIWFICIISLVLVSCSTTPITPLPTPFITAIPTANFDDLEQLCTLSESDNNQIALEALEQLYARNAVCTDREAIDLRLVEHLLLVIDIAEADNNFELARDYLARASEILPNDPVIIAKLAEIETLDTGCSQIGIQDIPDYMPSDIPKVQLVDRYFMRDGERFNIRGVTYFPMRYAFSALLDGITNEEIDNELELIRESGVNTLRVMIGYTDLFTCEQDTITINIENLVRLDSIMAKIAEAGLYIIPVLHADLGSTEELFTEQSYLQTMFIISRYQQEAAILAWDLREQADRDAEIFGQEAILSWLSQMIRDLRNEFPQQLFTSSWIDDVMVTAPIVDFVSLQHFGEFTPLQQKIANIRGATQKPILLMSIGYSTSAMDETAQRTLLFQAMDEVRNNDMLGWVIFMAFDYPRKASCYDMRCPVDSDRIYQFGLWNTSYFPKLSVDAVEAQ